MPATMTLIIGQFQIKGFRVMKTKFADNAERFFIKPPANRLKTGKWIDLFWTDSKDDWKLLEKKALKQFDEEQSAFLMEKQFKQENKETGSI